MSRPSITGSGQRRSSYASVLSGNPAATPSAAPPRSGFLSNQLAEGASLSQSFPSQQHHPHGGSLLAGARSHSDDPVTLMSQSNPFALSLGPSPLESAGPDFFVPSYLKKSCYIERLQERHRARLQSQKDVRSARSSVTGSLSTSASAANLHKMVPSHRGMTHEIVERPFRVNRDEPLLAELPSRWSAQEKAQGIEVSSDGSELKFAGSTKNVDEGAAARTDRPIPREVGIYYFEIDLLSKPRESQIAIGLSASTVVYNRMPGWEPKSWAYHGDDGNAFCQSPNPKTYAGVKFGSLDTVGCGVNFRTNSVFFTKNGSHLGTAFRDISNEPLYPTVGFKRPNEQIRVNFGQSPFVYNIDRFVEDERAIVQQEINKEDVSSLHPSHKEQTLLQELVAQYLAHDGYTETAKAFATEVRSMSQQMKHVNGTSVQVDYKEDQDAINRQRIRSAILEGDVASALQLTDTFYPEVLRENNNIYFKLRCRIFIEMIRQSTELQGSSKLLKRRKSSKAVSMNGHGNGTVEQGVFDGQMELDDEVAVDDGMDVEPEPDGAAYARQAELLNAALAYGQELQTEFKDNQTREVKQALEDTFALIAYPDARESTLAPLLEADGRVPVAEALNSAILVSLGKSSNAVLERLYQQTEVLLSDLSTKGTDGAALINPRQMR